MEPATEPKTSEYVASVPIKDPTIAPTAECVDTKLAQNWIEQVFSDMTGSWSVVVEIHFKNQISKRRYNWKTLSVASESAVLNCILRGDEVIVKRDVQSSAYGGPNCFNLPHVTLASSYLFPGADTLEKYERNVLVNADNFRIVSSFKNYCKFLEHPAMQKVRQHLKEHGTLTNLIEFNIHETVRYPLLWQSWNDLIIWEDEGESLDSVLDWCLDVYQKAKPRKWNTRAYFANINFMFYKVGLSLALLTLQDYFAAKEAIRSAKRRKVDSE